MITVYPFSKPPTTLAYNGSFDAVAFNRKRFFLLRSFFSRLFNCLCYLVSDIAFFQTLPRRVYPHFRLSGWNISINSRKCSYFSSSRLSNLWLTRFHFILQFFLSNADVLERIEFQQVGRIFFFLYNGTSQSRVSPLGHLINMPFLSAFIMHYLLQIFRYIMIGKRSKYVRMCAD